MFRSAAVATPVKRRKKCAPAFWRWIRTAKTKGTFARGLRNAVGLRWIKDQLYRDQHGLGPSRRSQTRRHDVRCVQDGTNYGWPYCYQSGPGRFPDPKFNPGGKKLNCRKVPRPTQLSTRTVHRSVWSTSTRARRQLSDSFLVALHGSTKKNLNRGYRVVRLPGSAQRSAVPEDFINGFLKRKSVWPPGRYSEFRARRFSLNR